MWRVYEPDWIGRNQVTALAALLAIDCRIRLGFIRRSADTNTGPFYCWIIDAAMDRMTGAVISHVDITNKLQPDTTHSIVRAQHLVDAPAP